MAERRKSFLPSSSQGGELSAYEPSYRENLAALIARGGRALGLDNYEAGKTGRNIVDLAEWSPLGLLTSYDDAQRAASAGDIPGMLMGAAGAIPMAGRGTKAAGMLERAAPTISRMTGGRLMGPKPGMPLPGSPSFIEGPIPAVVKAAEEYAAERGIPLARQSHYGKADPRRGRYIAEAYDAMEHAPDDPAVKASYQALADETMAQWDALQKAGVQIDFIKPGMDDPYPGGPREALADLRGNNHLWVFPSEQGFGTVNEITDNPLLADTGITVGGHPMVVNDAFRAVHDVFGHGLEGANFGARGEENAWRAHRRLFSPEAVPALTSETRGQNSWVNFGPYGEHNRANQRDTVFADQKTGLLPPWVYREGGMPPAYRAAQAGTAAALASALALRGSTREEEQ